MHPILPKEPACLSAKSGTSNFLLAFGTTMFCRQVLDIIITNRLTQSKADIPKILFNIFVLNMFDITIAVFIFEMQNTDQGKIMLP
jgi:hypothetical protein